MMFYPIFIPHSTDGLDDVYSYPLPVEVMFYGGLISVVVGLVMLFIDMILMLCFDKDSDRLFRVSVLAFLSGAVLMIAALPLMFLTGIKVE